MVSGQYATLFIVGFFVYIGLMILIAYLTSKKVQHRVKIT